MANDRRQRIIVEFDLVGAKTIIVAAARDQVLASNLKFLFFGIPGQFNDLHAIAKCGWNRIEHVCRRDEENAREIESDIKIMIAEVGILFGVEDLEQCGCRIATKVLT